MLVEVEVVVIAPEHHNQRLVVMVVVDLVVILPAETQEFLRHLELSPLAEVEVVQDISTSVQVLVVQEL